VHRTAAQRSTVGSNAGWPHVNPPRTALKHSGRPLAFFFKQER